MLSPLPPELLDLIVDYLRNEPTALKVCCLISKSWVHCTRRHIFADVKFDRRGTDIKSWTRAFPDPSNSPAHYAHSLSICGLKSVITAVTDAHTWVHSFRRLIHLGVSTRLNDSHVSLVKLQRLSPTLKSLRLHHSRTPFPEVLDFICSFSLLEDLTLIHPYGGRCADGWNAPTSPKFTGCLSLTGEVSSMTRGLLSLPGGLHFSKIKVFCPHYHAESLTGLVSGCSDTLEYLFVEFYPFPSAFHSASIVDEYLTTTCGFRQHPVSSRSL